MKRLAQFSILEFLLAIPVCVIFLFANLATTIEAVEFYPFNTGHFLQKIERGWPRAYQLEFDQSDFYGVLADSERTKRKIEFAKKSTPRITSWLAVLVNLIILTVTLAVIHLAIWLTPMFLPPETHRQKY